MNQDYTNITTMIDDSLLEFAKKHTSKEVITFDETSNQEFPNKEEMLYEIGWYVFAGTLLACRKGLYDKRKEILDYLLKQKLAEYNNEKLNALLKDYNIHFQISSYMVEAIQEWRKNG